MIEEKITAKEINRLAVPAIIAGISEPLISLADTAIVGHLGSAELAGVGIGSGLFLLFIWTLSSMKSAISSIVAQYVGKGKVGEIQSLVPQTIIFALLVGLGLILATIPFSGLILDFFYQAKGQVLTFSNDYYNVRAWGYPFTLATFTIFGVFRGCQNTSWAMKISLIGGIINLLLDYSFVYGIWIPKPLGVEGAAYASLIAQIFMFLAGLVVLRKKFRYSYRWASKLNAEFRQLIQIFFNLLLRTVFLNVAYSLAIRYSTSYGKMSIAAHTIAMNIWLFSAFFIDGYANAGNAIAGKLFGGGQQSELRRVGLQITRISVLIGALLGAVYAMLYPFIANVFTSDKGVVVIFNSIFIFVILSQPINGISFALDGIFKGLGRASLLRNTLFLGTFLVFVPTLLLLDYFELEMYAVWVAFSLWMIFRAFSLLYVFRRDYK